MRNPSAALHWTLLVALLGSCSSESSSHNSHQGSTHEGGDEPLAVDAPALLRFETAIRSILEDSKGNYWFGSWNEGVCRFDGERYTYFTEDDGLSNNQVRTILEDRNGVIWFECGKGINSYDGQRMITHTSRNYTSKDDWQLAAGDLWFKEEGAHRANELEGRAGVYRYDGKTLTWLAFPFLERRNSGGVYAVTGIARGKGGKLWVATYGAVIGYDGESFTIIDNKILGVKETNELGIRCVFEDSTGNLWIGGNRSGVFLYDGNTAINFADENGFLDGGDDSPSLYRVFSIGEDRAGNIWFGTLGHGAWRYDGKSLRNFTAADGLTSKGIMAIYTDRRGDLLLGGVGVYRFNGKSFDRIH